MDASIRILCPGESSIRIVKWKVKNGSMVSKGAVLALYEEQNSTSVSKLKSTASGIVDDIFVDSGMSAESGKVLLTLRPEKGGGCTHPTVMKDMCADCGADLRREPGVAGEHKEVMSASVAMVHNIPELIVSQEQALELGREDETRLLKTRKLVLLVDLDQTLIHTTNDNVPPHLKDVYHFQMWQGRHTTWYHTKLRPYTRQFLQNIAQMFELHICTFGVRLYAHTVARLIDPDEKFFSHRILSRDECFDPQSKTANLKALFPCGDAMVCIIDDREDVWNNAPNLVHVKPYHFFQGTADINAPPGLGKTEHDNEPVSHKVKGEGDKDGDKTVEEAVSGENGQATKLGGDAAQKNKTTNADSKSKSGQTAAKTSGDGKEVGTVSETATKVTVGKPDDREGSVSAEVASDEGRPPPPADELGNGGGDCSKAKAVAAADTSAPREGEIGNSDAVTASSNAPALTADSQDKKMDCAPSEKAAEGSDQSMDVGGEENTGARKDSGPMSQAQQLAQDLCVSSSDSDSDLGEGSGGSGGDGGKEGGKSTPAFSQHKDPSMDTTQLKDDMVAEEVRASGDVSGLKHNGDEGLEGKSKLAQSDSTTQESGNGVDTQESVKDSIRQHGSDKGTASSQGSDKGSQGSDKDTQGSDKGSQESEKDTQGSDKFSQASEKDTQGSDKSSQGTDKSSQGTDKSSQGTDKSSASKGEVEWDDDDDYLLHLEEILTRIHKAFYLMVDQRKDSKEASSVRDAPVNITSSKKSKEASPVGDSPVESIGTISSSKESKEPGLAGDAPSPTTITTTKTKPPPPTTTTITSNNSSSSASRRKNTAPLPDLKLLIPYVKRKALKGCNLVFSGVVPLNTAPEKSRAYLAARALGASVQRDVVCGKQAGRRSHGEATTHLVAAKAGTSKHKAAVKSGGVRIVHVSWLWSCADRWERSDERLFPLGSLPDSLNSSPTPNKRKGKSVSLRSRRKRKSGGGGDGDWSGTPEKGDHSGKRLKIPGDSGDNSAGGGDRSDGEMSHSSEKSGSSFAGSVNPLLAFSDEDLECMDKEVDELMAEDGSDDESEESDTERDGRLRSQVLGSASEGDTSSDSLSAELPRGWGLRRKSKSSPHASEDDLDLRKKEQVEAETEDTENELSSFQKTMAAFSPDSDSSTSYAESIGSVDDEIADAVEKEFLDSL